MTVAQHLVLCDEAGAAAFDDVASKLVGLHWRWEAKDLIPVVRCVLLYVCHEKH